MVRIKLDAGMERPEERGTFKHADLKAWIRQNRAELVKACLTIIRAWVVAGMPNGTKNKASFETWARMLGGVLDNACIVGFLDNVGEVQASDDDLEALRNFIAAWWAAFGNQRVRVSDRGSVRMDGPRDLLTVMDDLDAKPGEYLDFESRAKQGNESTAMGKFLGTLRERVFCIDGQNVRVMRTPKPSKGVYLWYLDGFGAA